MTASAFRGSSAVAALNSLIDSSTSPLSSRASPSSAREVAEAADEEAEGVEAGAVSGARGRGELRGVISVCGGGLLLLAEAERDDDARARDLRVGRDAHRALEEFARRAEVAGTARVETYLREVDERVRLVAVELERRLELHGGELRLVQTDEYRAVVVARRGAEGS